MAEHEAAEPEAVPPAKIKKKLLLIAVPVLLIAAGAGGWFSGVLPGMLGMGKPAARIADGPVKKVPPSYVEVPEIVTNLVVSSKRQSFMKLRAKLELAPEDVVAVTALMPRIQDLFETYLRDMRPEELRGSEGTYRLREELVNRASVAVAPAHVGDVLFTELVIE